MTSCLRLPAKLDLSTAADLRDLLRSAADGDVTLDASDVVSLRTPGLQVLMSAKKTLEARGKSLAITNAGQALRAQLSQFGLAASEVGIAPAEAVEG